MVLVWESLGPEISADILQRLPDDKCAELAARADTGKLAVVLSRMDEPDMEAVLDRFGKEQAAELRSLLAYPADTAGRLMDTHIRPFRGGTKVREAVEILRQRRAGQAIFKLKIVDEGNKLLGTVDIRDLALAEPDQTLDNLARGVTAVVFPMDPQEEVVEKLQRFMLDELPVIDTEGHLLGTIRHRGLIDALRETVSLDMQTMVGASREERATSSSWFAVRKRMPWLQINLLTAFLAAAVVGLFEGTNANSRRWRFSCRSSPASRATQAHRPWRSPCADWRSARSA